MAVVNKLIVKSWLMWLLPLMFFTYQFILRLWPSLTMQHIMQQYNIDIAGFGLLSAMYYLGYAGMQIPVAIMLERLNLRYIIATFTILSGMATFIFTHSDHWLWALVGRFLIGFASAAGFLGTSKAVTLWFPENYYARMIGFTFSIGLVGAVFGGQPLNALIEGMGYVSAARIISCGAIIIGIIILTFYRNPPASTVIIPAPRFKISDIKKILMHRPIVLLAIANMLMVGALEGFADIWGVTFLVKSYDLSQDTAAGLISFIYIGMLFGGPILAFFSERFSNLKVIFLCGISLAIIFTVILCFNHILNAVTLKIIFLLVGILCCYQVVVFSTCANYVDAGALGVTIAFMNTVNMMGGFFFHIIIGVVAKLCWGGQVTNGCAIYSSQTYCYALLIIPVCALIGSITVLNAKQ